MSSFREFSGPSYRIGDIPGEAQIRPLSVPSSPSKLSSAQKQYIYFSIFFIANTIKLILSCLALSSKVTISGHALAASILGLNLIILDSHRRQLRLQKKCCSLMFVIQIISFILSVVTIAELFKQPIKSLRVSSMFFLSQAILWAVIEIFRTSANCSPKRELR